MNTETEYLKSIAEEIAAGKNASTNKANHHLATEAKRLEASIIHSLNSIGNFTQRDTFLFNTLSKLVNICDLLYAATDSLNPDVMILMDLMTAVRQITPDQIRPNLKLPKAFIALYRDDWQGTWSQHSGLMRSHGVAEKLIEIAGIPFRRFTEAKHTLYWGDYTWLKGYISKLEIMDWESADCNSPEEALLSLLIGRDFNDDRFYIYCKKYVLARTRKISGKRQKLLEYAECQKLVLQDTQTGVASFDAHANSVSTRLLKWIGEEIDFVETHEREKPLSKFEFKWNVETIAFFFKLLWDHKVFGKVSLEPLSEQIAANCSSVGKDEFQATTIFSRFYVKDAEVLKTVEKVLSEMLEDVRRFG
ncbi:MAG: hypothetical protein JST19_04320 [Bacteroidetes bacterium]|nr:hypothetical protein [Bacteroidota bacterium]